MIRCFSKRVPNAVALARALAMALPQALLHALPRALPSILALAAGLSVSILAAPARAEQASVAVRTVAPREAALPDIVEAFGTVLAPPAALRTISLAEPGRVTRLLAGPGELVAQDAPLLEWQQSGAARQAWEQASSALVLARAQRAHIALLEGRHLATRDQLDAAGKALTDAQANLDTLRREQADQPLRLLRAPVAGIVTALPVTPGERVAAGTPLATLAARDGLVASVGADPSRLAALRPGETAHLQDMADGRRAAATVQRVAAGLDPATGLIAVALAPATLLPAGSDVRAEITVGSLHGWLVPHGALLQDAGGDYLFQVDAMHAVRVPVRLLRGQGSAGSQGSEGSQGSDDLVAGALRPDRAVVTDGAYQLSDGAPLRLEPAH